MCVCVDCFALFSFLSVLLFLLPCCRAVFVLCVLVCFLFFFVSSSLFPSSFLSFGRLLVGWPPLFVSLSFVCLLPEALHLGFVFVRLFVCVVCLFVSEVRTQVQFVCLFVCLFVCIIVMLLLSNPVHGV